MVISLRENSFEEITKFLTIKSNNKMRKFLTFTGISLVVLFLQNCKPVSEKNEVTETKEVTFTVLGSHVANGKVLWVEVLTENGEETSLNRHENIDAKRKYFLGEKLLVKKLKAFPILVYKDNSRDTLRVETRYWVLK